MHPIKYLLNTSPALLLALCLTACSDDDDADRVDIPVLTDVVTLADDAPGGSSFTVQNGFDGVPATYTTSRRINTKLVAVGQRLLISYEAPSTGAYTDGEINLLGYAKIVSSTMGDLSHEELAGWDADPVYLMSAWMSGPWLNIRCKLTYDTRERRFGLARDTGSADPTWPDLYLVHQLLKEDWTSFDRQYYASFSLDRLLDDPDVRGFNLHVANSNLTELTCITFALR